MVLKLRHSIKTYYIEPCAKTGIAIGPLCQILEIVYYDRAMTPLPWPEKRPWWIMGLLNCVWGEQNFCRPQGLTSITSLAAQVMEKWRFSISVAMKRTDTFVASECYCHHSVIKAQKVSSPIPLDPLYAEPHYWAGIEKNLSHRLVNDEVITLEHWHWKTQVQALC